jgi:hypothetical protein
VSTNGAKPADAFVPVPGLWEGLPVGVADPEGVAVGSGAVAVGVGFGVVVSVGRPLGSGVAVSSVEHLAPSMRQLFGDAVPLTTKPMVTDSPGLRPSVSHFGGVTVTWPSRTLDSAFHRELSFEPDGRSNYSFQSFFTSPVSLVTTYCAVYPVDQSLVLV